MGTAATANEVVRLQEDSVIPLALKIVFNALPAIAVEYSVIMKVGLSVIICGELSSSYQEFSFGLTC